MRQSATTRTAATGGRIEITMLRDHQLSCAILKTISAANAREKLQWSTIFEISWTPSPICSFSGYICKAHSFCRNVPHNE